MDTNRRNTVLQVEGLVETALIDLCQQNPPYLNLIPRTRNRQTLQLFNSVSQKSQSRTESGFHFPGNNSINTRKFAIAIRILALVHEALINNFQTTKRNIYYKNVSLFKHQEAVDRFVDDLAFTLGKQRADLNVVASPKGLVKGCFNVKRVDGSFEECFAGNEGSLVPVIDPADRLDISKVAWVLIVEKEASFRALITSTTPKRERGGIIITGKGYPDIVTRRFIKEISHADPLIPIFALVDWDPDGVAIYMTYAYGSIALAHESYVLAVPEIIHLGISSEDALEECLEIPMAHQCKSHNLDKPCYEVKSPTHKPEVLQLCSRDRLKAVSTLRRLESLSKQNIINSDCKRELQVMLLLNSKAEISIVGDKNSALSRLVEKMRSCKVGEENFDPIRW